MAQWFEMLMEGVERNLASRNRERYNNEYIIIKYGINLNVCIFSLDLLKICLHLKKN